MSEPLALLLAFALLLLPLLVRLVVVPLLTFAQLVGNLGRVVLGFRGLVAVLLCAVALQMVVLG